MNNILLANPGYSRDLYDKYLAPSVNQKPVFTKEELQYIKQAAPILVSYDPSFAPLTYQSKKSGQITGVTADIFEFIAKNSGLRLNLKHIIKLKLCNFYSRGKYLLWLYLTAITFGTVETISIPHFIIYVHLPQ